MIGLRFCADLGEDAQPLNARGENAKGFKCHLAMQCDMMQSSGGPSLGERAVPQEQGPAATLDAIQAVPSATTQHQLPQLPFCRFFGLPCQLPPPPFPPNLQPWRVLAPSCNHTFQRISFLDVISICIPPPHFSFHPPPLCVPECRDHGMYEGFGFGADPKTPADRFCKRLT